MRWYTSDTHFSHENIIRYCTRPFANASVMNKVIIQNWNELVKPEDTVYHLGDVAFTGFDQAQNIMSSLNGYKILILGNHDKSAAKMIEMGFKEAHQSLMLEIGGTQMNLSHYPYIGSGDPKYYKPKFDLKSLKDAGKHLIHGHVHTSFKSKPGLYKNIMVNVGVDQWEFKPVSEPDLITFINQPDLH